MRCAAGLKSCVKFASNLWDGRRNLTEVQENANMAPTTDGSLPPVAAWVCPTSEGRTNKRTKRVSGMHCTFGIDVTNTAASQ